MKTKKIMLVVFLVAILFVFQGCEIDQTAQSKNSINQDVPEESSFGIEECYSETSNEWPAGTTIIISMSQIENSSNEIIDVIKVEVQGADEISGINIEDMHPRLTEYSGGSYAGPHFFTRDGSIWNMFKSDALGFDSFKKSPSGWESIVPLEWVCENSTNSMKRLSLSLVANQDLEKTVIDLHVGEDYLIAGEGFEEYTPAAHGSELLLNCN